MAEPRNFRLGERGLARVFGRLEARIMELLWRNPTELSVRHVSNALEPTGHYKTVMTVLGRLVDKGLLRRRLKERAYLYQPTVGRDDFLTSVADGVIGGLLDDYGDIAVARFINALETVSPESVDKLEQTLRKRRSSDRSIRHGDRGVGDEGQ